MDVIEPGLGQHFGQRHAASQFRAPGNRDGDNERVEAAGDAPADRLGNRPCMGLGGTDEIVKRLRPRRLRQAITGMDDLDDAHADRLEGFRFVWVGEKFAPRRSTVGLLEETGHIIGRQTNPLAGL